MWPNQVSGLPWKWDVMTSNVWDSSCSISLSPERVNHETKLTANTQQSGAWVRNNLCCYESYRDGSCLLHYNVDFPDGYSDIKHTGFFNENEAFSKLNKHLMVKLVREPYESCILSQICFWNLLALRWSSDPEKYDAFPCEKQVKFWIWYLLFHCQY